MHWNGPQEFLLTLKINRFVAGMSIHSQEPASSDAYWILEIMYMYKKVLQDEIKI